MKKSEIAQLLTIASGFDRRDVDDVTIESWSMVPELIAADYEAATAAVIAHQTGPRRGEYLTIGHIVDALRVTGRSASASVEADVRSAKARKMIDPEWPARQQLPPDVMDALTTLRDGERRAAASHIELDNLPGSPIVIGEVGRSAP